MGKYATNMLHLEQIDASVHVVHAPETLDSLRLNLALHFRFMYLIVVILLRDGTVHMKSSRSSSLDSSSDFYLQIFYFVAFLPSETKHSPDKTTR